MGTPDFAVPVLQALARAEYDIVAVVTQPDRPVGRRQQLSPPPVKIAALAQGIPVLQPERLRDSSIVEQLRALHPEVIVVAAFGQILPPSVLAIPPHGCLNVHASLLPKYRGAAPINAAILAGDQVTGVTIMLMEPGLDTGPILAQRVETILPDDTAESLSARLAVVGAQLLVDVLPEWAAGRIKPRPQNHGEASHARALRREDGRIDWTRSAALIERRCRAYYPWPGCYSYLRGRLVKMLRVAALSSSSSSIERGRVVAGLAGAPLAVVCGEGALAIERLQLEGKRPVSAEEFLRGYEIGDDKFE